MYTLLEDNDTPEAPPGDCASDLADALADAHRAVGEARLLAAERAVCSDSPLVEFEVVLAEYSAAYRRFSDALAALRERERG